MNKFKKKFFPCFMNHQDFLNYAELIYLAKNQKFIPYKEMLYLIDEGTLFWEIEVKKHHAFIGEGDYFGFHSEEKKVYKAVTNAVLWAIPLEFVDKSCSANILARVSCRDTERYNRWISLAKKQERVAQKGLWQLVIRMQQTKKSIETIDEQAFLKLFCETSLTNKEKEKFLLYLVNQNIVLKMEQIYVLSYVNLSRHVEEILGI
ncbi:hypothetical protein ACYRFS_05575 [Listeria kieliensis]|uniref:Cyclic nucleotide-binding domain-containing protein n=1 Tax=Listeria kieliensis TaxID=1621700 RepID=A0A3D8TVX2_9LIST|nr:hypothetical protein [Listeria kieliensis]RDX02074.1 hypothetical protein UR08_00590 [Listeria kieliensis]